MRNPQTAKRIYWRATYPSSWKYENETAVIGTTPRRVETYRHLICISFSLGKYKCLQGRDLSQAETPGASLSCRLSSQLSNVYAALKESRLKQLVSVTAKSATWALDAGKVIAETIFVSALWKSLGGRSAELEAAAKRLGKKTIPFLLLLLLLLLPRSNLLNR